MFSLRQLTINQKLFVIFIYIYVVELTRSFSLSPSVTVSDSRFVSGYFVSSRMQWCHTVWFFSRIFHWISVSFGIVYGGVTLRAQNNYCAITTIFVENQKSCSDDRQIRCWRWVGTMATTTIEQCVVIRAMFWTLWPLWVSISVFRGRWRCCDARRFLCTPPINHHELPQSQCGSISPVRKR